MPHTNVAVYKKLGGFCAVQHFQGKPNKCLQAPHSKPVLRSIQAEMASQLRIQWQSILFSRRRNQTVRCVVVNEK